MTAAILEKFFEPGSIALIGATRTPGFGFSIPRFLKKHGWLDKTFLVNPKGGEIEGKRIIPSINELPGGIDLAIIIVPAAKVKEALVELGKKGVTAAVIESAGFAETGEEGKKLQDDVLATARGLGMRLLGPNCVGVVNSENKFATIEVMDQALSPGRAAIIAQSGVFGNILLDHLPSVKLNISKVATLGNKIDLDETDFLQYFADDDKTSVILIYQEGVRDGRRFLQGLKSATAKKPVIILKSGRTPLGSRATLSHTGSLSGEDLIYDAAFKQGGAVRAESLSEMIDLAKALSTQPRMSGQKVGILTTSGSIGAITSDALYRYGLGLADWSGQTVNYLRKVAPGYLNVKNPLDMGPSGIFKQALEAIFSDPGPDAYILIPVVPFAAIEAFRSFGLTVENYLGDWALMREKAQGKPVITVLLGYKDWREDIERICGDKIACVDSPDAAAKSLWALSRRPR